MKIGNYIKEKRLQKGMTQEELALKSDITVRTVQRIESGDVDPRSYTLQAIASALEMDYNELIHVDQSPITEKLSSNESFWLAMLHLSGLLMLVIPTVIIWLKKKDKIHDIRAHVISILNFQISMVIYYSIAGLLCIILIGIPIIIFLGIYSSFIIIINTVKAINNQPYRYPISIKFLKE